MGVTAPAYRQIDSILAHMASVPALAPPVQGGHVGPPPALFLVCHMRLIRTARKIDALKPPLTPPIARSITMTTPRAPRRLKAVFAHPT